MLTYGYYANDQVHTISQDGISKTYALDPTGRQRRTIAGNGTTHASVMHYGDGTDAPAWTAIVDSQQQEVSWERDITGIDGNLAAIHSSAETETEDTVLQLSNLHGDIVATVANAPNATALADTFETDEYGNPRTPSSRRYGWLGAKQRRTKLASGVIQMGVRSYLPALGRFSSVDPMRGGSSNTYDYAGMDPLNVTDLTGGTHDSVVCYLKSRRPFRQMHNRIRARARVNCAGTSRDAQVVLTVCVQRRIEGAWIGGGRCDTQTFSAHQASFGLGVTDTCEVEKSEIYRTWALAVLTNPGQKTTHIEKKTHSKRIRCKRRP